MKRASAALALIIATLILVHAGSGAQATTWYVDGSGSGDFLTIQEGIDASSNGDTVVVAAWTYTGTGNRYINFSGKEILLVSEGGPDVTIIDAESVPGTPQSVFHVSSGENSNTIIDGFTVTGASSFGIYISGSAPTIQNCVITGNDSTATENGGGIYCHGSSSMIDNCTITNNYRRGNGGGINIYSCADILVMDCLISGNGARDYGGGISFGSSTGYIIDCTITGNSTDDAGGGVYISSGSYVLLEDCLIAYNTTGFRGGGLVAMGIAHIDSCDIIGNEGVWAGGIMADDYLRMQNSTVAYNTSVVKGAGIYYNGEPTVIANSIIAHNNGQGINTIATPLDISCSDVYGNSDGDYTGGISDQTGINDNISDDPLFCDHPGGDYSIGDLSPCAPANSPCGQLIGRNDVGCTMVADLIIADVYFDQYYPVPGDSIQVTIKIKNTGNLAAENFITGLYFDLSSPPVPGMSGNIFFHTASLAARDSLVHVIPNISNDVFGSWNSWVQVDYTSAVPELDENNNVSGPHVINWTIPTTDGWPVAGGGDFHSSPVIALLDNDPRTKEVVIGCDDGYLYAYSAYGTTLPGQWPVYLGNPVYSSPAVGNIIGDYHNEIVVGCGAYLYAFDWAGTQLWSFGLSQPLNSTPALVDLDGDGHLEIVFSRRNLILDLQLFALAGDGTLFPGSWPVPLGGTAVTSPAVGDMDQNGTIEIAVISSGVDKLADKSFVHLFNADGTYYSMNWPVLLDTIVTCSPVMGNVTVDPKLELIAGGLNGTIYAISLLGNIWPSLPQVQGSVDMSLALAQLDTDDQQEIIAASRYWNDTPYPGLYYSRVTAIDNDGAIMSSWPQNAGPWLTGLILPSPVAFHERILDGSPAGDVYGWESSADAISGFPVAVEGRVYSSLAIGDLDGNGYLDMIVATSADSVYAFDLGFVEDFEPAVNLCWPFYRNDKTRSGCYFVDPLTDAGDAEDILPTATAMQSIHPNPFNPATTITFDIGARSHVRIAVYDAAGRAVCVLKDAVMGRGRHEVTWNGNNSSGISVSTGVYFCRLSAGEIIQTEKIVLLR